jgi:hypothetical protein
MEESVHRWDSFTVMLRARMAFSYSLASNVAAQFQPWDCELLQWCHL